MLARRASAVAERALIWSSSVRVCTHRTTSCSLFMICTYFLSHMSHRTFRSRIRRHRRFTRYSSSRLPRVRTRQGSVVDRSYPDVYLSRSLSLSLSLPPPPPSPHLISLLISLALVVSVARRGKAGKLPPSAAAVLVARRERLWDDDGYAFLVWRRRTVARFTMICDLDWIEEELGEEM